MTQGASCDYMTVAEGRDRGAKEKELAVDILAGVGIIALTIVNPVAGAVAAGAYTAYSAANATTGKIL